MLKTKPSNIQVETLKGQWTEESAWRAVRSWLQLTTPRRAALDLVGAQDDSMAVGAQSLSGDSGRRTQKMFQLTLHWLRWNTHHGVSMGAKGIARRNDLHSTDCGPGGRESRRSDSEWNKATGILGDRVLLDPPSGCTESPKIITCCVDPRITIVPALGVVWKLDRFARSLKDLIARDSHRLPRATELVLCVAECQAWQPTPRMLRRQEQVVRKSPARRQ
jgi:hypothetical protein